MNTMAMFGQQQQRTLYICENYDPFVVVGDPDTVACPTCGSQDFEKKTPATDLPEVNCQ